MNFILFSDQNFWRNIIIEKKVAGGMSQGEDFFID